MANQYQTGEFKVPYGEKTLAEWGDRLGVKYDELVTHVDEVRNRAGTFTGTPKLTPQRSLLYSKRIAADMLAFLAKYQELSMLVDAAAFIGTTTRTIAMWRREYSLFADLCGEIQSIIVDAAEDELYKRAVLGEERPVDHQGVEIGKIRTKSDDLLKFLLNGNRSKYRAKSEVAMTGANGGPLQVEVEDINLTHLRERLYDKLVAKQGEIEKAAKKKERK